MINDSAPRGREGRLRGAFYIWLHSKSEGERRLKFKNAALSPWIASSES